MSVSYANQRLTTGVRNLDALLHGGLPKGSAVVFAGPPGAGKTILAQQICFHNASPKRKVIYFNTLSEPTAKTLRYISQFDFFDREKLETSVEFVDLGVMLRSKGLEQAAKLIMDSVRSTKPEIVVIDSFKVFEDLARSREELRKFSYELAVQLMAWESTCFFLGEFNSLDIESNPLFSVVDGLVAISQREESGENQRFLQVLKLRGTDHSRDEHPFIITSHGIELFAPRVTINREARKDPESVPRLKTGISKLDDLLGEGIPRGSSLLVGGVAGTGKTVLLLELLYRGAQAGEKGIIFSFEETEARLRAAARGLGLALDPAIDRGLIEIVFIPQPNILVEQHLVMMQERVAALGARRVCVDSVSVFLHKIEDPRIAREKIFQLASIVQNAQAVGFFATDVPYGAQQISRFGVEETVVDGVVLLSSSEDGLDRQRYLEVYKMRNTAHLKGRHSMAIDTGGITIFPRYSSEAEVIEPAPSIDLSKRLPSGIPGLDPLLGGGLLERSVTLVSGSAGIGKSAMAVQFLLAGSQRDEPGLYVALEEGPEQLAKSAEALGLPLEAAVRDGRVQILYLPGERLQSSQMLSLLSEKIAALGARRVVLDSIIPQGGAGAAGDETRLLLQALGKRFKELGATTLFTLESAEMYSTERITDQRLSPVADNLIALRYVSTAGELQPTLLIVKCRGSQHDYRTHRLELGAGGVRIGDRYEPPIGE